MYTEKFVSELMKRIENEDVLRKLAESTSAAELKAVLAAEGLELEAADAEKVFADICEMNNGELNEELLDDVAGGCILCGIALVGSAAVTAYVTYKVGKWIVDKKYGK